jgi:hypothetical protein
MSPKASLSPPRLLFTPLFFDATIFQAFFRLSLSTVHFAFFRDFRHAASAIAPFTLMPLMPFRRHYCHCSFSFADFRFQLPLMPLLSMVCRHFASDIFISPPLPLIFHFADFH